MTPVITHRELKEASARGLTVMVHHRDGPKTMRARALMIAEVQAIAAWASGWSLDPEVVRDCVVEPVKVGLLLRYPEAEALRLFGEFVAAFDGRRGLMLRTG